MEYELLRAMVEASRKEREKATGCTTIRYNPGYHYHEKQPTPGERNTKNLMFLAIGVFIGIGLGYLLWAG